MTEYERPSWRKVALVGVAFLLVILIVISRDAILTDMDEEEFCENRTGMQKYPVCERNEHKSCHGKIDVTVFLDCGGVR